MTKVIIKEKAWKSFDSQALISVGITGLEPATSRPPEVYQLGLNPVYNQYYTDYLCFKSDGFSDGFHHVLLNFNISILALIP